MEVRGSGPSQSFFASNFWRNSTSKSSNQPISSLFDTRCQPLLTKVQEAKSALLRRRKMIRRTSSTSSGASCSEIAAGTIASPLITLESMRETGGVSVSFLGCVRKSNFEVERDRPRFAGRSSSVDPSDDALFCFLAEIGNINLLFQQKPNQTKPAQVRDMSGSRARACERRETSTTR